MAPGNLTYPTDVSIEHAQTTRTVGKPENLKSKGPPRKSSLKVTQAGPRTTKLAHFSSQQAQAAHSNESHGMGNRR